MLKGRKKERGGGGGGVGAIRLFTVFPRVHLQEGKNTPTEMGPRFAFGLD